MEMWVNFQLSWFFLYHEIDGFFLSGCLLGFGHAGRSWGSDDFRAPSHNERGSWGKINKFNCNILYKILKLFQTVEWWLNFTVVKQLMENVRVVNRMWKDSKEVASDLP